MAACHLQERSSLARVSRSGRRVRRPLRGQWLERLMARRHLQLCSLPLGYSRSTWHRARPGRVQFGGPKGRTLILKAGDVAILPTGTGHQCLKASGDFLVVGAYPPTRTFDICTTPEDRKKALVTIPKVAHPREDPVYGAKGPLMRTWRKPIHRQSTKKRRAPVRARAH
jgi:hypothetical protein